MLLTAAVLNKSKSNYRFTVRLVLLCISLFGYSALYSQQHIQDQLKNKIDRSASDSERITALGELSEYYYANKNFKLGDSLIEKQIMLAEATMSQHLILQAYFGNAGYLSTANATKDRSENTVVYIKRALGYAKANDLPDYSAMAYSNLAALNRTDGLLTEAFKNASLAFATALNTTNDSAKIICAIELGNVHLQQSDVLMAFKTYTTAINIASGSNKANLLPPVYYAMANLYKKLGNEAAAKPYIFKSLAINKANNNLYGQINDNIFLAKMSNYTAGKEYLQQAVQLADSIQNIPQKIEAEKVLFFHMMLQEQPSYMLNYLEANPELKNVFLNTGPDYLKWMTAEVYLYRNNPDSAINYFRQAEAAFNTGYDYTAKKNFFSEYANCLQSLGQIPEAITYYQKSIDLAKTTSDLRSLESYANTLKTLYAQQGDYKQAFNYSTLYNHYKDSVDLLGKEKDLALMEIDNEAKEQVRQADLAAEQLRKKYNLQYMLITIIVATVFVLLIMIGMFKVSTTAIRLMGFLSLIFFFEFLILILDNWIHDITHGAPWKVWLIKITIISFLLPVHHFLEHKLIRYLLSRHLITVRSRFSQSAFFWKKKKPLPPENSPEEEAGNLEDTNP